MVIFHSFLYVYQRVPWKIPSSTEVSKIVGSNAKWDRSHTAGGFPGCEWGEGHRMWIYWGGVFFVDEDLIWTTYLVIFCDFGL